MSVPLWFFIACIAVAGVKLARPPLWLVIVLLIGGYILANSLLAPAIDPFVK
ncbi:MULTISPECIES: hypothetical protein [Streptomyces]|uniref:hypothetical protein n=1 Tax=Streptomyces TaxID=1883 RepID=UPI001F32647D|nr:hypothetical protein [Streptomyces olivochromogenes]MCF3137382.1 hypothetical protein [Streptomyces olivochromogenes]